MPPIPVIVASLIGLVVAMWLGVVVSTEEYQLLAVLLAIVVATGMCLTLRQNLWVLIPILGPFGGALMFLPLPVTPRECMILMSGGLFLVLIALKRLRVKLVFDYLDILLFANVAYVGTVFFRNPVGVAALGSETVGGRPYFNIAISLVAYWVYIHVRIGPKLAIWLPLLTIGAGLAETCLNLLTKFVPGVAAVILPFYSGVDTSRMLAGYRGEAVETTRVRYGNLSDLGFRLIQTLQGFYKPLTLLSPVYFWRFLAFVAGFAMVLMGGFRTRIFHVGLFFILATWVRQGGFSAIRATLLACVGAVAVVSLSYYVQLPFAAQRALSFLPGDWEKEAADDARGSTEWRRQMWAEMLEGDPNWTKNKWLGDGFGFSARDLRIMYSDILGEGGFIGGTATEAQKITGAFHNGPLSAIRYVGMVGLVLYMALLCTIAVYSYRLIRQAIGTPYLPYAMILGVPELWTPINYVVVFGGYDSGFPNTIAVVAALRLVKTSLDAYQASLPTAVAARSAERIRQTPEMRESNVRRPGFQRGGVRPVRGFRQTL